MTVLRSVSLTVVVCAAAVALLAGIQVSPAWAQQSAAAERSASGARPVATAAWVAEAPVVDGRLDDRAW